MLVGIFKEGLAECSLFVSIVTERNSFHFMKRIGEIVLLKTNPDGFAKSWHHSRRWKREGAAVKSEISSDVSKSIKKPAIPFRKRGKLETISYEYIEWVLCIIFTFSDVNNYSKRGQATQTFSCGRIQMSSQILFREEHWLWTRLQIS